MYYNNKQIKKNAMALLKRNYWWIILTALLFGVISGDANIDLNIGNHISTFNTIFNDRNRIGNNDSVYTPYDDSSRDRSSDDKDDIEKYDDSVDGNNTDNYDSNEFDDLEDRLDKIMDRVRMKGSASKEDIEELKDVIKEIIGKDKSIANAIIGVIIIALIITGIVVIVSMLVKALLFNPLKIGLYRWFLNNRNENQKNVDTWGYGFTKNYKNVVKIMFLRDLYTFFWGLLFIIPGIVKGYEYKMIPYLLAENADMTSQEVFERTKTMMRGRKSKAFYLDLSFIGWNILVALTSGLLGIFFVNPYYYLCCAEFYIAACFGDSYYEQSQNNNQTLNIEV